jgi:hypothetical protein
VKKFSLDYRVFSFPFTDFGIRSSLFEKLKKDTICSLTFGCAGIKEDIDPMSIQRIPVESYAGSIKSIVKKEYLYHSFLRLLGKGKMKR